MKSQELKDYVKQNHKDFGGSMTNQQIANHAMCSNARISQIKKELKFVSDNFTHRDEVKLNDKI